jgi:LmbE family N-acetylglucosaminyl deacetylase
MKARRALAGLALAAALAAKAGAAPNPPELKALPLDGVRRLLVLAPHCDDETLGSAGLIQEVLGRGGEVRVVMATNGDGFLFATMEEFRKVYPRHEDFVRMGTVRQQESLAALKLLGVAGDRVSFLSYPDRGSPALWNDYWSASEPYRSPYSGDDRSPYEITYDPSSVYCGEDYLADLRSVLAEFKPDLVMLPHPNDVHPDHWGLSVFARLAVVLQEKDDPDFRPAVYTYLVHRHDFPEPRGLLPAARLLPPEALWNVDPRLSWLRLDLDPRQVLLKEAAVFSYRSQIPLLRGLLESFVRSNELFETSQAYALPSLSSGELLDPGGWKDAEGRPVKPVQPDPGRDVLVHALMASADLIDVYAGLRPDGSLAVCARLRGPVVPELGYVLRVAAAGPQGVRHWAARSSGRHKGALPARVAGPYFGMELPADELGQAWYVLVEAEVHEPGLGTLDQSAWCLLRVQGSGLAAPAAAP